MRDLYAPEPRRHPVLIVAEALAWLAATIAAVWTLYEWLVVR